MHNSLPRSCTLFSRLKTEKKKFIKKVITVFAYIRDSLHNRVHLENLCIYIDIPYELWSTILNWIAVCVKIFLMLWDCPDV